MTILVFDSGIGGLTVLRETRVLMPSVHFTYVADDKAFPYGDWDEDVLLTHVVDLFGQLIERFNPNLAIIACNTASTLALAGLRETYPDLPFVGTVPAIKPAAERTQSGLVSVLATPGTVKRDYTRDLITSFAERCEVNLVGSKNLAAIAEAYISGAAVDESEILKEIRPCFIEDENRRTDIIVLACTHYPFLANLFRKLAPWPVDWLDPAEAIARHALSLSEKGGLLSTSGSGEQNHREDVALFTSGNPEFAIRRLQTGFGLKVL